MISFWKKNKYSIVFLSLFIIICFVYQYQLILFYRPQGFHQWRQTIGLSFALNYFQHGMIFFLPEVHHLVADKGVSGYTATEFPLLYFIHAALWKVFGVHEFIPRLVNGALLLAGLFSIFKIISRRLNIFWGIFLPLLFFTSPIVAYYSISFLPDSPAFGIALISLFCFDEFTENQNYKYLHWFISLSIIAGLLKVTSAMVFASVFMIFVFEKAGVRFLKNNEKIFNRGYKDLLLLVVTVACISAWYFWAMHFDEIHDSYISDSRILPIWNMNQEEILQVMRDVYEINWYQFLSPHTTFIFLFLFAAVIFLKSKVNKYLWTMTMLLFAGTISYILLWFAVWGRHDYYMFPIFFLFISTVITLGDYLKNNSPSLLDSKILKTIFILFFSYNTWYCSNNIRMRYGIEVGDPVYTSTNLEAGFWSWFAWDHNQKWKAYETIESYNRKLGIHSDDLVISVPDESICISLYLMNQKGWTKFGNHFDEPGAIEKKIQLGAKYLLVGDSTLNTNTFIQPYLQNKIGQYRNISIYDLRSFR